MRPRALRGIVHVHSAYSYDGHHSLSEIAKTMQAAGLDFVCITEHSDTLDAHKVAGMVKECEMLSSPNFLMIPGIEFTCEDKIHILGIGAKELSGATDLFYVNDLIQRNGWISVMAHPSRRGYRIPSGFLQALHGVEIWNCGYDGRFFPNATSFDLYMRARKSSGNLVAIQGMDLHLLSHFSNAYIALPPSELEEASILNSLRAGHFSMHSPWFKMPARPEENHLTLLRVHFQHKLYVWIKKLRDQWHRSRLSHPPAR